MDIRPYAQGDRENCLLLFDSNTPQYFVESERDSFEQFLMHLDCPYFVLEQEGAIVGCGGFVVIADQQVARLRWGMVQINCHKHGLGRLLLLFRLREIGKLGHIQFVSLRTSQYSAPFFEKQGFKMVAVVPDGFTAGMDQVEMVKKLIVCT